MVHALKNIAIRLWIATMAGGIATLGLLAVLGSPMKPSLNIVVTAILVILAFLGCGWIFNRIAALRLQDYLREATARERVARIGEAAAAYRKAVILFDSFMVSPLFRYRMGRSLAGRIARFHIARTVRYPEAEAFLTSYLWSHPNDGEVAEYWLQHTPLGDKADPDHLALVDRLATTQHENPTVQSLVAQIYLARQRTDYTALQTYKGLLRESNHIQALTVARLADLFIREERADEWALEVYLKAWERTPDRTEYLQGLAACLEQVRETERNEDLLTASREALNRFDAETIRQWRDSFRGKIPASAPKKPLASVTVLDHINRIIKFVFRGILHASEIAASHMAEWGKTAGNSWRESSRTRHIAKWAAVIVFAIVVIVSGISTIRYIRETKEPPESVQIPEAKPAPMATSGRYTIQVASFRNHSQAVNFTEQIKRKKYQAYSGESRSSDEDIWYYVRISRFKTKEEAKEFGNKLKSIGIIDDFYVTNYK